MTAPMSRQGDGMTPATRTAQDGRARPLRLRPLLGLGSRAPDGAPEPVPGAAMAGDGRPAGGQAGAPAVGNGFGALTAEGDYEIRVAGDRVPPAPWVNVVANPRGGFVVSERGGGFTWAENSYFFRLTPWHNDPVSDPAGEALYLRDEESGDAWSATPAPMRDATRRTRCGTARATRRSPTSTAASPPA